MVRFVIQVYMRKYLCCFGRQIVLDHERNCIAGFHRVVIQGFLVVELFACEYEYLLVGGNAVFLLDFLFDGVYGFGLVDVVQRSNGGYTFDKEFHV